jgi:glycosyltransferase involved in cell wall biosynthesis
MICRSIYPYSIGGAEIHSYKIAKALSNNHSIEVLFEGALQKKTEIFETNLRISPSFNTVIYLLKGLYAIIRYRSRPALISVQTAYAPLLLGFIISKILHVPFVVTVHGSDIRISGRSSFLKYLQKILLSSASRIMSVSSEIQSILEHEYRIEGIKIQVIGNGFDTHLTEISRPLSSKLDHIVFVGSLRQVKNPLLALAAVKQLKEEKKNIQLVIVGSGPLWDEMVSYIQNNDLQGVVRMTGNIQHEEVIRIISESDIFILTSIHEGLPTVLVEAMALAKPVVVPRLEGISELVKDGQNGFTFASGSIQELVAKLHELIQYPNVAFALGVAARQSVMHLTWTAIAKTYTM